jgi:hypothetical protein
MRRRASPASGGGCKLGHEKTPEEGGGARRQVASSGVHLGKPIACGADCSRPRLSWRAVGPSSSEEDRLRGNVVRLSFHACRIAATSPPATRLNKPRRGYRPSWLLVTSLLHRGTNVNMIAMRRLVRATTTAPHPPHRPRPYLTRCGLIHSLPCHHTSDTTHLCCHSHTSPQPLVTMTVDWTPFMPTTAPGREPCRTPHPYFSL